jgi:autophagy-related protein 18
MLWGVLADYSALRGVGQFEVLFQSNLAVLVGSGMVNQFPVRRLLLTDLRSQQNFVNLNFVSAVLAVKLNYKRMVVVLERKIHIFDVMANCKVMLSIDTPLNPYGVCCLSSSDLNCFLVIPSSDSEGVLAIYDAFNLQAVTKIKAHDGPIQHIALNRAGTLLATCSDKVHFSYLYQCIRCIN